MTMLSVTWFLIMYFDNVALLTFLGLRGLFNFNFLSRLVILDLLVKRESLIHGQSRKH